MLIRFRVKNFLSFYEEQELIMVKSRVRNHAEHVYQGKATQPGLLRSSLLFGANASGKSNFLDIIRFMRDVVNPNGGGLQQAVKSRGDMQKLRCLAGRQGPGIELDFELKDSVSDAQPQWRYVLAFANEGRGKRRAMVKSETVFLNGKKFFPALIPPTKQIQND